MNTCCAIKKPLKIYTWSSQGYKTIYGKQVSFAHSWKFTESKTVTIRFACDIKCHKLIWSNGRAKICRSIWYGESWSALCEILLGQGFPNTSLGKPCWRVTKERQKKKTDSDSRNICIPSLFIAKLTSSTEKFIISNDALLSSLHPSRMSGSCIGLT